MHASLGSGGLSQLTLSPALKERKTQGEVEAYPHQSHLLTGSSPALSASWSLTEDKFNWDFTTWQEANRSQQAKAISQVNCENLKPLKAFLMWGS